MSGIAGLVWKNQQPVQASDLARLSKPLAHRGPDASGQWHRGPVGLIQRAHWTTPGASTEQQPLALTQGGPVICADVRLDERQELIDALGLDVGEDAIGDAALILHAYERWGHACPGKLRGDFAFAIWDPAREELFCARDVFGVRPFYYHDGDDLFAFGSEIKALLALPGVPRKLDEVQLGFYLEQVVLDQERTFYAGLRRLAAGKWLVLKGAKAHSGRYYSLLEIEPLSRASDAEYIEEYARLFECAVQSRQSSPRGVGCMLSGGLDSSSIVCSARRQRREAGEGPLATFSHVFDGVPESNERPFIEAVIEGGGLEPTLLHGDQLDPFAHWSEVLSELDEPPYGANLFLNRTIYQTASAKGLGVMLDGVDGDSVVGYGMERLLELALRLQLPSLWREVRDCGRVFSLAQREVLSRYIWSPAQRHVRERVPGAAKGLWRALRGRSGPAPVALSPLIHPDFAKRICLAQRIAELRAAHAQRLRQGGGREARGMTQGHHAVVLEILDKAAAAQGIEPRYPYFDRSLVEYCLGLPPRMRLRGGLTRYIQREAGSEMPPKVRWRSWKGDLSHNFEKSFRRTQFGEIRALLRDEDCCLTPFVNGVELGLLRSKFESDGDGNLAFGLGKLISLKHWVERAGKWDENN